MRISYLSSDVCSSDLPDHAHHAGGLMLQDVTVEHPVARVVGDEGDLHAFPRAHQHGVLPCSVARRRAVAAQHPEGVAVQMNRMVPSGVVGELEHAGSAVRSEEQTSALQSPMSISSAVFCLV